MQYLITVLLMTCFLASHPVTAESVAGPTPEATRIIEEFGLREGEIATSAVPGWQPQRVVVSLPKHLSQRLPALEQQLRQTAAGVELVIDHSDTFALSSEVLNGADAIISACTLPTLNNASPQLLWLHSYFAGMDLCAGLSAAQIEGRIFSNSKRLAGPTIAEHAVAMMLSLARGLPAYQRAQGANRWDRKLAGQVRFGDLNRKTLLVVGLGGIGTQVAQRAHGLGMRVIATRNSSRDGPDYVDYIGLADELHALAAKADVIVNALPLTSATRGLFNAAFFEEVKPGAIFISVGRGKSTVTADLIAALESGQLFGAGLDVTDPEPLPQDSPLWQMDNVIITPHTSTAGPDSMRRIAVITVENLRRYLAGEKLLNVVDMRAGY